MVKCPECIVCENKNVHFYRFKDNCTEWMCDVHIADMKNLGHLNKEDAITYLKIKDNIFDAIIYSNYNKIKSNMEKYAYPKNKTIYASLEKTK